MKPPVPGTAACMYDRGEYHSASPVVVMMSSTETFFWASLAGSTITCNCSSRCPQMATFATPGTPISLGTIVHLASTDMFMSDIVFEDRPIIMTRPEEDVGCSICGGLETLARSAV